MSLFIFLFIFAISTQIEKKLQTRDFVIVPTKEKSIYDIYEGCKKADEPIFVTQDLILHTTHIFFDYTLRILEIDNLKPKLDTLTIKMFELSMSQAKQLKYEPTKLSALKNVAFFGVAAKLLGMELHERLPESVGQEIERELELIEAHTGTFHSPIFGYREDYTQYIPRGHYTRNNEFERYFKAMMWYGRIGFYLQPHPTMYYPKEVNSIKEGLKLTRMALLITKIVKSSSELARLWDEIYKPTIFFTGRAEDFTIHDYSPFVDDIDLSSDSSILLFIDKAKTLPQPKIISTAVADTVGLQGFRFMGQRFIPDSYILQNLVYSKVTRYTGSGNPFTLEMTLLGPMRCFPRALDVMWVFGSEAAGDILKEEGDTDYIDYISQVNKLKEEFAKLPVSQWKDNLYWRLLYAVKLLVTHPHKGYPSFMQSRLWRLKELNTALGAWAELRHDTILYAKQSYTVEALSIPRPIELTKGWVEPYPEIYRWISELVNELAKIGGYPIEVKNKIISFSEILIRLSEISNKELNGKELSDDDYKLIWNIGSILKNVTQFSTQLMSRITSGTDENMAVVADVHTDTNSKKVLEEGIGYPSVIYVKLPDKRILKGSVFSYYEFKLGLADRLTDETWQEQIEEKPPQLQKWLLPLMSF
ncbi:MAG: DUF3160 domain-containing protein [bacterium]|nr:DUF3160 domain-containing protein [bacterium]